MRFPDHSSALMSPLAVHTSAQNLTETVSEVSYMKYANLHMASNVQGTLRETARSVSDYLPHVLRPQNGVPELITVIKMVNEGKHFGDRIGTRLQVIIITSEIQNSQTQTRVKQIFKNYDLDWNHMVQDRVQW